MIMPYTDNGPADWDQHCRDTKPDEPKRCDCGKDNCRDCDYEGWLESMEDEQEWEYQSEEDPWDGP